MIRRTKIVATLGPSTDEPGMLEKIVKAGADVVRLNYSHETREKHKQRATQLRAASRALGTEVAIIADLRGPKIRIGSFKAGKVQLPEGAPFTIDADLREDEGDAHHVGVSYKNLPRDVHSGDKLLIDDGRVVLQVKKVSGSRVECEVVLGGEISNNKGINRQGGGLSAGALTAKDRADVRHAVEIGVDFIAISFARSADDLHEARRLIEDAGGKAGIIAKIERAEALDTIDAIVDASEAIMIARGDLGVEIGDAALPPVQKNLIKLARDMDRAAITATQMMESMIDNQMPTRAEVFDVANAVLDGTDSVMLSAETSIGHYPDKAIEAMVRVCLEAEKQHIARTSDHRINLRFKRIDEAIAMSTMYAANHIGAKAIAALTETGATCVWMSRISSGIPIFAFTRHVETGRKMTLYRGVYPIGFDITHTDPLAANKEMISELVKRGTVDDGDLVIITKGDLRGRTGGTNNMKIVRVGEPIDHMV